MIFFNTITKTNEIPDLLVSSILNNNLISHKTGRGYKLQKIKVRNKNKKLFLKELETLKHNHMLGHMV